MTPTETAPILRQFNAWRRDLDDKFEQPDAREISEAIDAAVQMIDRLEAAESDALEQARLNGMGSEREAALMAKLEAAEKERDALRAAMERSRTGTERGGRTQRPINRGVQWRSLQRAKL